MSDELIRKRARSVHPRRSAPPPPAGDTDRQGPVGDSGRRAPAGDADRQGPAGDSGRRVFLLKCVSAVLIIAGLSSCETKERKVSTSTNPCLDYSDLSEEDLKKR